MDEQSVEVKIGREARCPTCPGAGCVCVCVCRGCCFSFLLSPPPPRLHLLSGKEALCQVMPTLQGCSKYDKKIISGRCFEL